MMALKRQISNSSKWPEVKSQVQPRVYGEGLVLQVSASANRQRFEASAAVNDKGGVLDFQMAALLREIAWMIDGEGEPPAWEIERRAVAAKKTQRILDRADRIRAGVGR